MSQCKCGRKFVGSNNEVCGKCKGLEVIEVHKPGERWTIVYPALVVVLGWVFSWIAISKM